ncbi:unnamed protein product [Ilex paraguariensis]|uniref:Uncharacterized protein n=1 Tax=Ilex paraguariensis TaxID=185542 RepID=A0ABC8S002_9AQUA
MTKRCDPLRKENMEVTILFFFLVAMAATSQTMSNPNPILLLRSYSSAGGHRIPGIDCLSWRLAVETNNLRQWKLVPEECENYVGHYMLGKQYRDDCDKMAEIALEYAESVGLVGDGKDVWVTMLGLMLDSGEGHDFIIWCNF